MGVEDRDLTALESREFFNLLDGAQSFECTAIQRLAWELGVGIATGERVFGKTTAFLPAERTWIEWRNDPETDGVGIWSALLLIDDQRSNKLARFVQLTAILAPGPNYTGSRKAYSPFVGIVDFNGAIGLTENSSLDCHSSRSDSEHGADIDDSEYLLGPITRSPEERGAARRRRFAAEVYSFLGMINAPKIFARIKHPPHRGLQRRLPTNGHYPLGAWTEILLKIPAPPEHRHGGGADDQYLTGERALHWCRAHLRYRLGQWEIVKDHWRGNPAIGIRRSRYRVTPSLSVEQ